MRLLYTIVIFGSVLYGQNSDRVFSFTHLSTVQDFQQIAQLLRYVGDLKQISVDSEARTLSVNGTANQIELANWLFHSVDVEPQAAKPAPLEYTVPGSSDDLVRVFYVPGDPTKPDMQELVNTLRTISDITHIYPVNDAHAIALRGTAVQVSLAAWILHALLSPAPGKVEYVIPGVREISPRWSPSMVRVFYPAHTKSAQDYQEVVNALRTVTDIAKIYQHTSRGAIVLLGNSAQIPLAEWLMEKLDRLPSQQPPVERFHVFGPMMPDTHEVRVFYLPETATAETLRKTVAAIRTETGIYKAYGCPAPRAVVLRATPSQASQAESMMANQ